MNPDQPKHGFPWTIPAIVVALFGVYMGTYYALVFPGFYFTVLPALRKPTTEYTHGGRFAETFFVPANWLDRMIRPRTWEEQEM
ncbi:MAG TPA: hypothetical protein VG055_12950 [Planctomycetaceae bacterium]|jgi:hypothetical protein|nr:hypothetical protein [Planctomycetaceae bacterium]